MWPRAADQTSLVTTVDAGLQLLVHGLSGQLMDAPMAERVDNEIRHRIDHGLHSEQGDASLWASRSISAVCTDRCNVVEGPRIRRAKERGPNRQIHWSYGCEPRECRLSLGLNSSTHHLLSSRHIPTESHSSVCFHLVAISGYNFCLKSCCTWTITSLHWNFNSL